MTPTGSAKQNKGSVYLYTLFFVMSLFALLALLLQITINNATPVFTNAHTIGLYHAGRSGIDLFLYHFPQGEVASYPFDFGDYQVLAQFTYPRLTATATSSHTAQTSRFHAVVEEVGDTLRVRNIYQPLQ